MSFKNYLFTFLSLVYISANAQKEGFAKGNGVETYYKTFGEGQPILIINGGPGMNSNGFTVLAQKLSKNNKAIIYDQRGTGKSALTKTDSTTITMDLMVEDIEYLRKELNIKKWVVLGHSFGGMLASYYATKHPENIEGLILSSSGGIDLDLLNYVGKSINSGAIIDSVNYWNDKIEKGDTSHNAKFRRGMALAPAYVFDKNYIPIIAERLTQSNSQVNNLVWADLVRINFNCAPKLATFKKPVLIIQGKQDVIEDNTAIKAQKALVNSKVVLMEHCKHYGWLDAEDIYLKEIQELLNKK